MNLLYTLTTYPPSTGGAQIHQHKLAQCMMEHHHIQVVAHWSSNRTDWLLGTTLKAPATENNYTIEGIKVHCMGFSKIERMLMAPYTLAFYPLMLLGHPPISPIASYIEKKMYPYAQKADLIHNVRIGREGISYASLNAARKFDIPFILTPVHHPRWVGRKYNAFQRLYKKADALLALTQAEKKIFLKLGVEEEKIHVIGHAPVLATTANPKQFLQKFRLTRPMVLFLGQHYPYKGYKELLEAAKIVWEKKPDTNFVFIGPAVGDSDLIFNEMSDPRIFRLGTISLQDKTNALASCSLLCVPSIQESFGGVYAEAWCFKKPVVGCDIPAVSEVITDEVDGFLVRQEPKAIADKIIFLLENEAAARQMGTAGKMKVEEKYNWKRIADQVEKIYNKIQ